jgi:hypothetical protein
MTTANDAGTDTTTASSLDIIYSRTINEILFYCILFGGLCYFMFTQRPTPSNRRRPKQRRGTTLFYPDKSK